MHAFPFSVITGETIDGLLRDRIPACVDVVRRAYLAHGRAQSINPPSYFLRFPEKPSSRIIALPAYVGDEFGVSGIKWIASYPENIKKGFPRASAVLILNDYETGYPFACLESSIISAARTAGSAVLGAMHLHGGEKRTRSLGIVGCGLISRYIYRFFLAEGWAIDTVRVFDTNPAEAERFQKEVCDPSGHARVEVAPDLPTLLRESETILFATVAGTPHVTDPALLAHNPVVLHISLRDLSPEIILGSQNVVDDVDHVMQANTSVHLAEQQTGGRSFVTGTIAEVMTGAARVDRSRPLVYSPFGLGVLDLAVGKWLHDLAVESGRALAVENFFYELTR